jgi:hypothetical protein
MEEECELAEPLAIRVHGARVNAVFRVAPTGGRRGSGGDWSRARQAAAGVAAGDTRDPAWQAERTLTYNRVR